MTRTKGGAAIADHILADLALLEAELRTMSAARDLIAKALRHTRFNPGYVEDLLSELRGEITNLEDRAAEHLKSVRQRIEHELPPLLQRVERRTAAANLPEDVAELRRWYAALEERLTALEAQQQRFRVLRKEDGIA